MLANQRGITPEPALGSVSIIRAESPAASAVHDSSPETLGPGFMRSKLGQGVAGGGQPRHPAPNATSFCLSLGETDFKSVR